MEQMDASGLLLRYTQGQRVFRDLFLMGGSLQGANLSGITIEDSRFHEIDFSGATLRGATLRRIALEYTGFHETDLSGATLQEITVQSGRLQRINLSGAHLQELRLDGQDLSGANLEGANLAHAQLQRVSLQGADLQLANLTAANLRGADLCGTNFQGAVLRKTILENTVRDGMTNFQGARYRSRVIADKQLIQEISGRPLGANGAVLQPVIVNGRNLKLTFQEAKQRIQAAIHGRRGQQAFRAAMLKVYAGRCAITGCDVEELLEAAHIIPYCLTQENHPWKGVLLRADLHRLFDLNFVEIEAQTGCVYLHQKLQQSNLYRHFHQQVVVSPPLLHLPEHYRLYSGRLVEQRWRQALKWRNEQYQEFVDG